MKHFKWSRNCQHFANRVLALINFMVEKKNTLQLHTTQHLNYLNTYDSYTYWENTFFFLNLSILSINSVN